MACKGQLGQVTCTGSTCVVKMQGAQPWQAVRAVLVAASGVYVGADNGLFFVPAGASAAVQLLQDAVSVLSMAAHQQVAAATDALVYFFSAGNMIRFDWCTNTANGAGGVYDETVRAMAYAPIADRLYLGTGG